HDKPVIQARVLAFEEQLVLISRGPVFIGNDAVLDALVELCTLNRKCYRSADDVRPGFFQEIDRRSNVCGRLVGVSEEDKKSRLHPKFFGDACSLAYLLHCRPLSHAVQNFLRARLGSIPDSEATGLTQTL